MAVEIRDARPDDAAGIAHLKSLVWQEAVGDAAYVASVMQRPEHLTMVAVVDGMIAGFVDGFHTIGVDWKRRWELDLLAVHPDYRGQGIGRMLVKRNTDASMKQGMEWARALITEDNLASQRAFANCGYRMDETLCGLYVSRDDLVDKARLPPGAHVIPVFTFNYRGVWLEGVVTPLSLAAARAVRTRHGHELAGVVLPLDNREGVQALQDAQFSFVGSYQWWYFRP